ncbi:hypothetical protein [Mycobacteroides immunogenum]|uniref:hypothetical protein n=1 Tax=Mycobacteroides immunogenum TaxID=83262 RepID=UPI000ADC106D|nr:hypothetical protein [Mycobacteroides immunogenum]
MADEIVDPLDGLDFVPSCAIELQDANGVRNSCSNAAVCVVKIHPLDNCTGTNHIISLLACDSCAVRTVAEYTKYWNREIAPFVDLFVRVCKSCRGVVPTVATLVNVVPIPKPEVP